MSKQQLSIGLFALCLGTILGGKVTTLESANAAESGSWKCYVVDRLPELADASEWKGAVNVADGLNAASPNTPSGTILSVSHPTSAAAFSNRADVGMVCVKS